MVMNGFDTNFDDENEFYAVNSIPFAYFERPIRIERSRPVRVYLVNITEFDPINSFHLHANFFDYYDHGTTLTPTLKTVDTVMQCQGQRGILEFTFAEHEPGIYMFHAHQSEFAELGWMSHFEVVETRERQMSGARRQARRNPLLWLALPRRWCSRHPRRAPLRAAARRPDGHRAAGRGRSASKRARLTPGLISLTVRADGSEPVSIAQVQVDGAYRQFTQDPAGPIGRLGVARIDIPYPWVDGEAHHIALLTGTGAVFDHDDRGGAGDAALGCADAARAGARRPAARRRAGRDRPARLPGAAARSVPAPSASCWR